MECNLCSEDGNSDPPVTFTIDCHGCEEKVCDTCWEDVGYIKEWLVVPLVCHLCEKPTCTNCLTMCYDCANEGEEFVVACEDCQNESLEDVCEMHIWYTCGKHEEREMKCGECLANYNYCMRHAY